MMSIIENERFRCLIAEFERLEKKGIISHLCVDVFKNDPKYFSFHMKNITRKQQIELEDYIRMKYKLYMKVNQAGTKETSFLISIMEYYDGT